MILKPLQISVVLSNFEVWDDSDKVRVSSNYEALLDDISDYRQKLIQNHVEVHDYTLLISGIDFTGNTVGYAWVGTMCQQRSSSAVVQHFSRRSATVVAHTVAHEMGHSLGANHDNEEGVMGSASIQWGNSSKIYFAKFMESFGCLRNEPDFHQNGTLSSCGNGILEGGEQCDCGTEDRCNSLCCHPTNCTLKLHAVCSSGPCCDPQTCHPVKAGTTCRYSFNSCDLPEFCSGSSEFCPKNVFKSNGHICDKGKGHCFNGDCGSLNLECKKRIAPSASEPIPYFKNKLPLHFNVCMHLACQTQLKIRIGTSSRFLMVHPEFYVYSNSPLVFFNLKNKPKVSNGMYCDVDKMCVDGTCSTISLPSKSEDFCSNGCAGNGVCNTNGNCHCDGQYAPPSCAFPGFGGSVDSGHAFDPQDVYDKGLMAIVIFFIILLFILLFCCFWRNISEVWVKKWSGSVENSCPHLFQILDECCCPCFNSINKFIFSFGSKWRSDTQYVHEEGLHRRKTICQVDMDMKPPEVAVKTWGNADQNSGVTDVITITPKHSPRTTRKVRLPSDAVAINQESAENLRSLLRPGYNQTVSQISSNISDDENYSNPQRCSSSGLSMGSLVSLFSKFGRQNSTVSKHGPEVMNTAPKTSHHHQSTNLRRLVVDPLAPHRTGTNPRDLKRSVSSDASSNTRIHSVRAAPAIPTKHAKIPNSHRSEQNLHYLPVNTGNKINSSNNSLSIKSADSKSNSSHSSESLTAPRYKLSPKDIARPNYLRSQSNQVEIKNRIIASHEDLKFDGHMKNTSIHKLRQKDYFNSLGKNTKFGVKRPAILPPVQPSKASSSSAIEELNESPKLSRQLPNKLNQVRAPPILPPFAKKKGFN